MNSLEQEYADNLRRVRERETRRGDWFAGACGVGALAISGALVALDGPTPRAIAQLGLSLGVCGLGVAVLVTRRLQAGRPDRPSQVLPALGYRQAPPATDALGPNATSMPGVRMALVVFVLANMILGGGIYISPYGLHVAVGAATIAVMALGVIIQRYYAAWRKKRNARLELEMERWLSADR